MFRRTNMEEAYSDLDSVKDELKKVQAECKTKTELSECLKKAHSEQLLKFEEAKQLIEKQSQELKDKYEEVAEASELSKKLESCLHEKDLSLRHLCSMNEKAKDVFEQKLRILERKNIDLVSSLDEMTTRNKELEQDVYATTNQIEGFKKLLLSTEKKCTEAQQMAKEGEGLRDIDEMLIKLEEENNSVQDQLKWKQEQFKHLEEAHKRLQDEFDMSKENWKREKLALMEETSTLQTSLDCQTITLEGLQTRLEMCNHSLAREESKRKFLEVQVSDFELRFENAIVQFQEENSQIQRLTVQRNEEIAMLQTTLAIKETLAKEVEFKTVHLEQENKELIESLKELQEAQIRNAGTTTSAKMHNKLRHLENAHISCSEKLTAKELECLSEIEKIKGNVISFNSELKDKDEQIKKLQMELESCCSTIQVLNEEITITLAFFKSEISEAYSKTYDMKDEMKLFNKKKEENVPLLTAQLEMSCSALDVVRLEFEEEQKKVESLAERVDSLEPMKQPPFLKDEELQRHKKILEEYSVSQLHLKNHCFQMESCLNNELPNHCEVLEKENAEPSAEINEVTQLEAFGEDEEVYRQMKNCLLVQDEMTEIFKKESERLTQIFKEKDMKIKDLQQQVELLETKLAAQAEEMAACLQDNENQARTAKEENIANLLRDIDMLKQESRRRELEAATLAQLDAERIFTEEKEMLLKVSNEKDDIIENLKLLAASLEQHFTNLAVSFFSEVIEKQVKIDVLTEALAKKSVTAIDTEDKDELISHLEKELCSPSEKLAHQEDETEQLKALIISNKLETESLMDKQRSMEQLCKQLELDREVLLQDIMKLSIEKENLLGYAQKICDSIGQLSSEDVEMMKVLGKMLPRSNEEIPTEMYLMVPDELCYSTGENAITSFSATTKKLESSSNERSPLMEVNQRQI
ncbi:uncharacterized protein At4g38062-like [Humulus lupulus]|uniref:uncharacterized protein At4g38062-like n=1 Tax=Humulus lupulus TaxID=3486 RepID=UPI002B4091D7|nr:uncharacterized protein At4g38062-like [Humulus lupulus]